MNNFKTTCTKNYMIGVNDYNCYGYFEHNSVGDESTGGLWFDSQKVLRDYDGVFRLPKEVIEELVSRGYNMDYALED